jgi:S-(hydroxymethyl)glutathione dehydrogenase/alcohol dehydrogenase
MPAILDLAARGVIVPANIVTRRYRLDQADEAYQALSRGEIVGRAIVVP